jgi:hypothetical protein
MLPSSIGFAPSVISKNKPSEMTALFPSVIESHALVLEF